MTDELTRRQVQGQRVKMARAGAGLSRERMAEAISERWEPVSRDYIRRIEVGTKDAGYGFLLAAAEVTGQPVEWFTAAASRYVKLSGPLTGVERPTDNRPPSRQAA
jgi:transcriptional regulator with XRE-family HTH domain